MIQTPLKTATRVLSLATLVVMGFSAWAITTQDLSRPVTGVLKNRSERQTSLASESSPVVTSNVETRQTRVDNPAQSVSPTTTSDIDTGTAATLTSQRTANVKATWGHDAETSPDPHPTPRRGFPKISPNVGQAPVTEREFAPFEDDPDQLAKETRHPQSSRADALRTRTTTFEDSNPTPVPATVFTQVDTRLATLQRQVDQLAQAQNERKLDDLQQATELIKQLQQQKDADKFDKLFEELQKVRKATSDANATTPGQKKTTLDDPEAAPDSDSVHDGSNTPGRGDDSQKRGVVRAEPVPGQPERFSIQFQDADISEALAMLGQLSGLNILVGRGVSGKVPAANLQDVSAEQALDAVTRALGYVYEREGNFVFVQSQADAQQRKQAARKTVTKIYRPRYVASKDLQTLVTPLITKAVGIVAVTSANEAGLEVSRTKAGGDSLTQTDALLVVDYPEVIAQVDLVIQGIDVPPSQVVIEAMILSVKLTENMKLGVNFALLNSKHKQLLTVGNGSQINSSVGFPNDTSLIPAAGDFVANTAGLKYGFLAGNISGFLDALESLTDTSVVASPSVRVLNKQRAELIIGERLGYRTTTFNGTQTVENVNFLEVGTKLILRPYVTEDGLVRMEIHPERSDGKVVADTGLPESRTTEVTSNVMVRDGTTIVIGGLIEEQVNQGQTRVPGLAGVPVVGNLFKSKAHDTTRTELIVLITPRVIRDPEAEAEGAIAQADNERRHEEFRDHVARVNRSTLARLEYERAARYFEEGDLTRAKWHIEQSLRHNRNDDDSLRLRDQIVTATNDKNWFKKLRRKPPENYHRVPSTPTSLPNGEAMFEFESESRPDATGVRPASPPVPPAPANIPTGPSTELRSPASKNASVVRR